MATVRRHRKIETTLLEAAPTLGGAAGLMLAAGSGTHQAKPCAAHTAADCVGHVFSATLLPYVVDAAVGALLGLLVAAGLLLVWRAHSQAPTASPSRQSIPERVRHEVWRRDGARCVDCGARELLEFDHIIPVSKGGSNTARNLELRCERCNRLKGARI
jgi:hypothetical protein